MKEERAKSKIQVKVLDLSGLEKQAFDSVQSKNYNKDLDSMRVEDGAWGYVETSKGTYLISSEGVGDKNPISEDNPACFEFSKEFNRNGERSFELSPCIGFKLDEIELKQIPVKEVVTLDSFIRSFGTRLEHNYLLWQDHLNKEIQTVVA